MELENRIYKSELVEWRNILDLQPKKLKKVRYDDELKTLINKHHISKAFDVWEDKNGVIYFIDGHQRKRVLLEMWNSGVILPDKIMCNFVRCKNKKEAISILLDVHNTHRNKIDKDVLLEFLDTEFVELEDVELDYLEIDEVIEIETEQESHEPQKKELTNMIVISLTDEEQEIYINAKNAAKIKDDKKFLFNLINKGYEKDVIF